MNKEIFKLYFSPHLCIELYCNVQNVHFFVMEIAPYRDVPLQIPQIRNKSAYAMHM